MPTVRRYERQVQTAPVPAARKSRVPVGQIETPILRASPSAESTGAGLGETLSRVGGAFLGQELERRERERQEAKARQDRVAILEADRNLSEWENRYLHDPKQGALNRRGKESFGLPETVSQEFERVYGELSQSLTNEEQRFAFNQLAHTRRKDVSETVTRYVAGQMRQFEDLEHARYMDNTLQAALANAEDPIRITTEAERGRLAIASYAGSNGLPAEWTKAETARFLSSLHAGVIESRLTRGQTLTAQNHYDNYKDDVFPAERAKIEKDLAEGSSRRKAQLESDRIMRESASRLDAIERAKEIENPEIRDRVTDYVRSEWMSREQAAEDARQERNRQAAEIVRAADEARRQMLIQAGNIVDRRGTTDAIPIEVWNQMTVAEKSAMTSYGKALRDGGGQVKTDQSHWYELMRQAADDPDGFAKRDLLASRAKLDDSDFQEIAKLQKSVKDGNKAESDKALDGIRTNERIIGGALRDAGIDPDAKDNRARVDQLWRRVDEQIQTQQRLTGKKATNDDIQGIVDGLLIEAVPAQAPWFKFNTPARLAFETTLVDIPAAERTKIENALRGANLEPTDEAILNLYIQTQQRLNK